MTKDGQDYDEMIEEIDPEKETETSRAQDLTRRRSSRYGLRFQEGKKIFFAEINQINNKYLYFPGVRYRDLAEWRRRLVLQINVQFETFILYLIFSMHNHVRR